MKRFTLLSLTLISFLGSAQLDIKVMCYNVLNYPTGIVNRKDTLEVILNHYTPDIIMVQELKSFSGLDEIEDVLNTVSNDTYASGTYVTQQSNPSSSWKLQQNLVYNTRIFGLAQEEAFLTDYRDLNYFKLYIKDDALASSGDTTFLHVFTTHLKSSQGNANEQIRFEMSQVLRTRINELLADSYVLCGGDFNLYTSAEDAYQHLITQSNVVNPLVDPIDMPGNWHNSNFPNKEILTQSTRLSSLDDGAGGGVDDRFDFILQTSNFNNPTGDFRYVQNSYKSLGNNGTCYNQDLINCTTQNNVPANVLSALYYMSDHLPVVMEITSDLTLSTKDENNLENIKIYPNPAQDVFLVKHTSQEVLDVTVFNANGKAVVQTNSNKEISIAHLDRGIYFVLLSNSKGNQKTKKLVIQ